MDIVAAYEQVGTYRGAAALCGTTHKTVRRVIERRAAGDGFEAERRQAGPKNTDLVAALVERRVRETDARISAKRLLPAARADGYAGSDRNFRRVVRAAKQRWRRQRRVHRPWRPGPGEHLVLDWGTEAGLQVFCAVLPWSRWRFVRLATDQTRASTLRLLAECFEAMGAVPAVVLTDRMACLRAGVVANVVVAHPEYVRFAHHFGFRPDFCEAADPESKGIVEALVGYAQVDCVLPGAPWSGVAEANAAAVPWCAEVNGRVHSETQAVPEERLAVERSALRPLPSLRPALARGVQRKVDKLATVRFGAARYSVPERLRGSSVEVVVDAEEVVVLAGTSEVARHRVVAPGEASILDEHYGGPRTGPTRAVRPRSEAERAFCALGEPAEAFLRAAAAAGTARLGTELADICALEAAWGREALVAALRRALAFGRFKAADVRSILDAGVGVAQVTEPGEALVVDLPVATERDLAEYALEELA